MGLHIAGFFWVWGALACAKPCAPLVGEYAAVMDPFGSGFLFRDGLRARGIKAVAVLRSLQIPSGYSFDPTQWDDVVVFTNPADTALELLEAGEHFRALIDGAESGTVDAAFIRDALRGRGVHTFGATGELAWARRDKVAAAEALGDLAPEQFASDNLADLQAYARRIGYPLIAKPNRNAGGSKGGLCYTEADLNHVFHSVAPGMGRLNEMLETDTAVILQKPLRGAETAFNGYRDNHGNIVFTGDWRYWRRARHGTMGIYVADRLLDPTANLKIQRLQETVREALRRTQTVGVFHVESIAGKIIDNANRFSGGGLPLLEKAGTNIDPLQLALDGYLTGSVAHYPSQYSLQRHVAAVFITTEGGAQASRRLEESLEARKRSGDVVHYDFTYAEGTPMPRTLDSDTVVASVLIQADSAHERETLIAELLAWQKKGLFELRPPRR